MAQLAGCERKSTNGTARRVWSVWRRPSSDAIEHIRAIYGMLRHLSTATLGIPRATAQPSSGEAAGVRYRGHREAWVGRHGCRRHIDTRNCGVGNRCNRRRLTGNGESTSLGLNCRGHRCEVGEARGSMIESRLQGSCFARQRQQADADGTDKTKCQPSSSSIRSTRVRTLQPRFPANCLPAA
jgi:hypothetical protein